jgi:sugar phosphate isomerase/epimerase
MPLLISANPLADTIERTSTNMATFTLSAFGDEISPDLEEQLGHLNELKIRYLDLRGAWGKNVLALTDAEVDRVKRLCAYHGIRVACIGSPIGKSPLVDPIEKELANLDRIMEIGAALNCSRIRVFSFYPPDISTNAHYDQYLDAAIERLAGLAERAKAADVELLHENEKEIVGDTLARCQTLVRGVDDPHLRFLWDPANFVQVGEARVTERGWPMLGDLTAYVHIKDAKLDNGSVCPAGDGDGQVRELLRSLVEKDYQGFLSLEPHLMMAGRSSGFSGKVYMTIAVEALRKVMAEVGCVEEVKA